VTAPARPAFDRGQRVAGAIMPSRGCAWIAAGVVALTGTGLAHAQPAGDAVAYTVEGDAIARPLGGLAGDATRGRAIVTQRQVGLCLLCHSGPFPEERFQGTLAPDLAGAWSEGQLRLRVVDSKHVNPDTRMPSAHRSDGLDRVGTAWIGRPVLTPQHVEDVVALLRTLRD
jgi:sulfur-oxidizing protein SoxX